MTKNLSDKLRSQVSVEEYHALVRSTWSEAEFTRQVISLAQSHGWRAFHQRPLSAGEKTAKARTGSA